MADGRTELVTALERGLVVLQSFSEEPRPMTLTEVARASGLNVATARRAVLTLEKMGYLGRNGRRFVLRPAVVSLSGGYLPAVRRPFQPFVEGIVREWHGRAAIVVLDRSCVISLAYASTTPTSDDWRGAGACCPAQATAAGRLLLSMQPLQTAHPYLPQGLFRRSTVRSQIRPGMSNTTLGRIRKGGCAFVRDEVDAESLSVAIPVFAPNGYVLAALEWSGATDAHEATVRRQHLPVLHRASLRIEAMLTEVPDLVASLMPSHATRAEE